MTLACGFRWPDAGELLFRWPGRGGLLLFLPLPRSPATGLLPASRTPFLAMAICPLGDPCLPTPSRRPARFTAIAAASTQGQEMAAAFLQKAAAPPATAGGSLYTRTF
jgi:hypothetical protein